MKAIVLLHMLVLLAAVARAQDTPISGAEARNELAQTGTVANATIEGTLDLEGLRHPSGGTLKLHGILKNAPAAALEIYDSELGGLRAPRSDWHQPIDIEHSVFKGHVELSGARFEKDFACRRCRFQTFQARRARFEEEADFGSSKFIDLVNFSGSHFHSVSFDGVRFADAGGGPIFNETDFAGEARFTRMKTGTAPAFFIGARFREEANFRGCRLGRGVFAVRDEPGQPASPFATDIANFGGVADFRLCHFLNGADFTAAAMHDGARFDTVALPSGILDLRGLTRTAGDIVLRDMVLGPGATIAIDQEGIASLVTDAAGFDPERWHGLSRDMLEAMAARAKALGADRAGRLLSYQAAGMPGASLTDRATWILQWPSANSTDILRPLELGGIAWLCAALLTLKRGALAEVATVGAATPDLFSRVIEPLYRPLDEAAARDASFPQALPKRAIAAATFGFVLVFKLGTRRFRLALKEGWRISALFALWVAGFLVVAVIVTTAAQLLPGLHELISALS
jgi:uncharacterized protein YjbI with pentapeptide repeats